MEFNSGFKGLIQWTPVLKHMNTNHKNCVIYSVMGPTHCGPFGVTYNSKKYSSLYFNFEAAKLCHWPGMSQKLQGIPF